MTAMLLFLFLFIYFFRINQRIYLSYPKGNYIGRYLMYGFVCQLPYRPLQSLPLRTDTYRSFFDYQKINQGRMNIPHRVYFLYNQLTEELPAIFDAVFSS